MTGGKTPTPDWPLEYDDELKVNLVIELNGREIPVEAYIDTGFTGAAEVRIPSAWSRHAKGVFMIPTEDSSGRPDYAASTTETRVIAINRVDVSEPVFTMFQDGPSLVGLPFLRRCVLHLDGPRMLALLSLP